MQYDVVVVGGGPAGMMAAGRAGELGARVLLLEKNRDLGVKLLITGKGRCNITNANDEMREMVNRFGKNGKFLFSALHSFSVDDTIEFFENIGVKTKVERGGRVFPVSDRSQDVNGALIRYLRESNVDIETNAQVKRIVKKDGRIEKIILANKKEIKADKFVIATGGKSYPRTGSTGDAYVWLRELGHKVVLPKPSLTPVVVKERIVKELEGLSLKNVEISSFKDNPFDSAQDRKKIDSRFGEAIFTSDGMSGPIILDMSKSFEKGMELRIDFKPALDFVKLDLRIQKDFKEANNKMFKNSLNDLLPQKMIGVIIKLSGIGEEKKVNLITKEERKKLLHLLKEFKLTVEKLTGFERAIVTAGGVDLSEVDPKTMKSKIIDNLYFAGEILDLDGPTGGYNLQVCWSTGRVVGETLVID